MESTRKNIIPVIILLSVFCIPLFFDNRLINFNILHKLLFSFLTLILCVIICSFKIKYSVFREFKIIFSSSVLFLLFLLISSEVNERLILSFEEFALYLNVFIFTYLVFLLFQIYDFYYLIDKISIVIVSVTLIISVLGILEFFNINILNFQLNARPGSTLSIRNFASEYSVLALPFALILILNKSNKVKVIFSSLSGLIILTFIFFCRTRSSYVVLAAYLIILTVFFIKYKYFSDKSFVKLYIFVILFLLISYLAGTIPAPNLDNTRTSLNNTVSSIIDRDFPENSARINYWKTALKIFRDDPFTGIGAGSWFGIYPLYNKYVYTDENILYTSEINPHNDYLEVLSENGIFGFIFFIIILFVTGLILFFGTLRKIIVLPVLLSFCGFLLISLFSFPKDNVSIMILFSVQTGISLALIETVIKNEETKSIKKIIKILSLILLPAFLIIIIIFSFIRYNSELTYLKAIKDKAAENYPAMLEKFNDINTFFYPVDPNKMPVEYYKGVGYYELKNYNAAMIMFENARNLAPYAPAVKSNIASSFYMLKDNENAIKLLIEMKRDYPLFIEPQINLLAIYANTGQDSSALNLLKEISGKTVEHKYIKNYFVLEKIKKYYNEKNSR